jgi:2-polyprenyl-3-methyl-5-hydroxy-6-metoxy-1,4-benzoquinol methylase
MEDPLPKDAVTEHGSEGGFSEEELLARVHDRWRRSRPTRQLSWGPTVTGDNFVSKAASYGVYGKGKAVLEVGPGWGRLLEACLRQGLSFEKYVGVEISDKNVRHLKEKFPQASVRILHGAIETLSLDERFDSMISSLTFKHLYPSFLGALVAVERHLNPGAVLVFDLIEQKVAGPRQYFVGGREGEETGHYVRRYTRSQIGELLSRSSLELVTYDKVMHHPSASRLVVVARKPAPA